MIEIVSELHSKSILFVGGAYAERSIVLQRNVAKVIQLTCHSEHPMLFRVRRISVLRSGDPSGAQNAPSG